MPKLIEDTTIYQATIDEILAGGYAGATMKRIAERGDVSELTLFRRYGGKAALTAAAVGAVMEPLTEELEAGMVGELSADLQQIVHIFSQLPRNTRLFTIILSEMERHPELSETLTTPNRLIRRITALIADYQRTGALPADVDALHIVMALLGPLILSDMLRESNPQLMLRPIEPTTHVSYFLNGYK